MSTSSQILASKSEDELKAGIAKANARLALIEGLEAIELSEPPRHESILDPTPGFSYESWSATDYSERRRQYRLARQLCETELARRAALSTPAPKGETE